MITIHNADKMDPVQIMQVQADMKRKGVEYYTMTPGNDCIWVYYGSMNLYYIFRGTEIIDVQID